MVGVASMAPLSAQTPSMVDLDPTPPPNATWPVYVDATTSMGGPGTTLDDVGTGRGQCWVDVVGPDPSDPTNPNKVGPPDGRLDLIQANSNSPAIPFGAAAPDWVTPPVSNTPSACLVYRAEPDGTLVDVAALTAPTPADGYSLQYPGGSPWGAIAADYDGDGDQDLLYPCGAFNFSAPNSLMENQGDGTFENVSAELGLTDAQATFAASWIDYDKDGDLDFYAANGRKTFGEFQGPLPNPTDRLYRNENGESFTEVSAQAGVALTTGSFSVSTGDLDRDGWTDIAVACYIRYNKVFYNNADGTFSFMAPAHNDDFDLDVDDLVWHPVGTDKDFDWVPNDPPQEWDVLPIDGVPSIPLELADFNGDGWIDILYGTYSIQLEDDDPLSAEGAFFEPAWPCKLYLNRGDQDGDGLGDGTFREVAAEVGLAHIGGVMGMTAADFNGDGFTDVYLGAGGKDLDTDYEEDYFYVNNGISWPRNFQVDPDQPLTQVFYEVGALSGTYANTYMSHGVSPRLAASGRVDMLIGNGGPAALLGGQPNTYFQNTGNASGPDPNYLQVQLSPAPNAPSALGSRVTVIAADGDDRARVVTQERRAGTGFTCHYAGPQFFGVGSAGALAIDVERPDGRRQGRLLWPGDTQSPVVALYEAPFSLGLDLAYLAEGDLRFTALVREFGAFPRPVRLFLLVLFPLGNGIYFPEIVDAGPLIAQPGTTIELAVTTAPKPKGLYTLLAVDLSAEIIGAGSVWHDPLAAEASDGTPGGSGADLTSPVEFASAIELTADTVRIAFPVSPLVWQDVATDGVGELAVTSGATLAWNDGQLTLTTPDEANGLISREGSVLDVSLGRTLHCCGAPAAADTERMLVRFEGIGPDLSIDGYPVTIP